MDVEKQITALENEAKNIKAVFDRSATTLPVFTKSTSIATTQNSLTYKFTYQGEETEYTLNDIERLQVTFTTSRGSNTLAVLEFECDNASAGASAVRINYDGGARWIISGAPKGTTTWASTTYDITVHSCIDGTLTVENMTS